MTNKTQVYMIAQEIKEDSKVARLLDMLPPNDEEISGELIHRIAELCNNRLGVELFDKDAQIIHLKSEIEHQRMRVQGIHDRMILEEKENRRKQDVIDRLSDAINHLINRMLRQTISQNSHGERNQQLRSWSRELLQILRINSTDDMSDIPF